ncbi:DUF1570 domain-containing protein [bacterium]|nr:DUF1570 domain-containing protein [bacterium]
MTRALRIVIAGAAVFGFVSHKSTPLLADTFEYIDENREIQTVDARLYATGQGAMALELEDGSLRLIPEAAVRKRTPGPDPTPVTTDEMLTRLQDEFGDELFRGQVAGNFVIGVILTAPLPKTSERAVQRNLLRAAGYMKSIEQTFGRFCRTLKVNVEEPRHPLVVLIFETDEDFEKYTTEHTGGRGLSAGNIAGFYSSLTNFLYVRMSECYTFGTPLHEAIHQQCFNTGVLARLAPVPVWFSEGMATGFEGSGDRVKSDPQKLNATYAKLLNERGRLPSLGWQETVEKDDVFRGDIFAGEAYLNAWSLHWLLVSRKRREYGEYLKYLQTLSPLTEVDERSRMQQFEDAFGESPDELRGDFGKTFDAALRRQRLPPDDQDKPGLISTQKNLAAIDVYAETRGAVTSVQARVQNISPIREMAYYVVVFTDSGAAAEWYLPKLKMNEATMLQPKSLVGAASRFAVLVKSTPSDSEENELWSRGEFPRLQRR